MGLWEVRAHVAATAYSETEAESLAGDVCAGSSRDDGNWSLPVTHCATVGPYDDEDRDPDDPPAWEVVVTFEVQADDPDAAADRADYWLEGVYGDHGVSVLHVEQDPVPAARSRSAARQTMTRLCEHLGSPQDPYGETVAVDGVDVYVSLIDRRLGGRPVVQLHTLDIPEESRGRGAGTRTVAALLDVCSQLGVDVLVGPITNEDFWGRYDEQLSELPVSYLGCGGGYRYAGAGFDDDRLALIESW